MDQRLAIPLTILRPKTETAYFDHDGSLILTYDVFRTRDNFQWFDLDERVAFGATYAISQKFRFNYVPGSDSLLSQLINTARNIHDPLILKQSWEMRTEPTGFHNYVRAFICQTGKSAAAKPQLLFCENTNWSPDYFTR